MTLSDSEAETAAWFLRQHGELLLDLLRRRADEQASQAAVILQAWRSATMTRLDILRELVKTGSGLWNADRVQRSVPGPAFTRERAWQMLGRLTEEGLLIQDGRRKSWTYPEEDR